MLTHSRRKIAICNILFWSHVKLISYVWSWVTWKSSAHGRLVRACYGENAFLFFIVVWYGFTAYPMTVGIVLSGPSPPLDCCQPCPTFCCSQGAGMTSGHLGITTGSSVARDSVGPGCAGPSIEWFGFEIFLPLVDRVLGMCRQIVIYSSQYHRIVFGQENIVFGCISTSYIIYMW